MSLNKAIIRLRCQTLMTKMELLFYPIFLVWRMPIAWARSLWAARILLNGRWHRYMGFCPQNAINSLFYRTQWINIDRYGRNGVSPILGLGAYPLRNWFHLSLLASYIYANAGAVTTLLGTLFWVLSHLVWMDKAGPWWVIAVTGILFCSTTAYAMAFTRQNYQILGWMWLPLALYSVLSEHWMMATLAWVATGLVGITPFFFALPVLAVISAMNDSVYPLLTVFPTIPLILLRFSSFLGTGGLFEAIASLARLIGMTRQKVKYSREMNRWTLLTTYFFGLYLGSTIFVWWYLAEPPILGLLGVVLFLLNQRFVRVADEQSLIILNASLWAILLFEQENQWILLAVFWIVVSPSGLFLSIQSVSKDRLEFDVAVNRPFDTDTLIDKVREFLAEVNPRDAVYFAFEDPENRYVNIFDGYRVIHELPLCVAAEKSIHLFPDWYAVQETNYSGAPDCWGNSLHKVLENCDRWGAKFAIVYGPTGSKLADQWQENFRLVNELDWVSLLPFLRSTALWPPSKPIPKWFLLKRCK